jgi:hypothetical protein
MPSRDFLHGPNRFGHALRIPFHSLFSHFAVSIPCKVSQFRVRSAIQNIFAEHKGRYGYRQVTQELRRRGMQVNHKRVARTLFLVVRNLVDCLLWPKNRPTV